MAKLFDPNVWDQFEWIGRDVVKNLGIVYPVCKRCEHYIWRHRGVKCPFVDQVYLPSKGYGAYLVRLNGEVWYADKGPKALEENWRAYRPVTNEETVECVIWIHYLYSLGWSSWQNPPERLKRW